MEPIHVDVFISYRHQDKVIADAVCTKLEAHGIRCWIAPRDVPLGADWAAAIVRAIDRCRAMVLVFSSKTNGSTQIPREVQRACDRSVPVIVLRIENVIPESSLAYYMSSVQWLDALDPPLESHLQRLAASLKPLARWSGGSPFPGLRALGTNDTLIFFGREREVGDLSAALQEQTPLILIEGASGSGKSSLVGAGLIPRVAQGAFEGGADWLLPVTLNHQDVGEGLGAASWSGLRFTPAERGEDPTLALAEQLLPLLNAKGLSAQSLAERLSSTPDELVSYLVASLSTRSPTAKVLIFIDQFEELYTLVPSAESRERFVAMLVAASFYERVRIVATIRADFSHMITEEHRELAELLQKPRAVYKLPAPGPESLADMINGPASVAGLEFSEGLRDILLEECGDSPGKLPLLAFALARLYRERDGNLLTMAAYSRMGGVAQAVGAEAKKVFDKLSLESQSCLSRIFHRLVEVDDRRVPTRKRAARCELAFSEPADVFVRAFERARLFFADRGADGDSVIEVAHEALFTEWLELRSWIEERIDDLFLKRQMEVAAAEWVRDCRSDQHLWPSENLRKLDAALSRLEIDRQRDLAPIAQDFIVPSTPRLREMIADLETTPTKRSWIGDRLDQVGDTRPGVGCSENGIPDIVWCAIPGGVVSLQENAGTFDVSAFDITKYPVTYTQYLAFINAADGYVDDRWWADLERPSGPGAQFLPIGNHPAETLSWYEAMAFSRWLALRLNEEIRLPTEWEWQQAATSGRSECRYPWGPDWIEGRANTDETRIGRTTSVGVFPAGDSEHGASDLSGNVLEWCLNKYENVATTTPVGAGWRVVRGGACLFDKSNALAASREHFFLPNLRSLVIGFRLVRSRSKR